MNERDDGGSQGVNDASKRAGSFEMRLEYETKTDQDTDTINDMAVLGWRVVQVGPYYEKYRGYDPVYEWVLFEREASK